MIIKFKGRTVKDNSYAELKCNTLTDNYSVSQRDISVIVNVNGNHLISLKECFEAEVLKENTK